MAKNNFVIRNIEPNDHARILEIEQDAHLNPWSGKFFNKQFSASARALLIEQDGQIVGYLVYHQTIDQAEILNLVTAVERQNQGCASLLLSQFLAMLETNQVKRVNLDVARDNLAAIALYTKHLFEPDGARKDYYQREHCQCDAILMSRSFK